MRVPVVEPAPLASRVFDMLFGRVVHTTKLGFRQIPCVQVQCPLNDFHAHHKMFFFKRTDFWAADEKGVSKIGDSVLLRRVEERFRPTPSIDYKVEKVVIKYGESVDPLTGRPFFMDEFKDEIALKKKLVGENLAQVDTREDAHTSEANQREPMVTRKEAPPDAIPSPQY